MQFLSHFHYNTPKIQIVKQNFSTFALNKNMENFNSFMYAKSLNRVAEKCVKNKIPIVEFVQWFEEEGQYLDESVVEGVLGSTLAGAGMGAGVGTMFGANPLSAGLGAGIGGAGGLAYGLGKKAYDYFSKPKADYNTTKQQAIDALTKFAKFSPRYSKIVNNIINYIDKKIQPSPDMGPTSPAKPTPSYPMAIPTMSLDDLFKNGLATREDLKRIAALPQDQRDAEIKRLIDLHQSRQSYVP